jgi:hypothetical protein
MVRAQMTRVADDIAGTEDAAGTRAEFELLRRIGLLMGNPMSGDLDATLAERSRQAGYQLAEESAGMARQRSLVDFLR